VRPMTPYLDTLYAASPGNFSVAYTPDSDAMLTIRPSPAAAMAANAARQHRKVPVRLIPSVSCQMADVVPPNGAGVSTPAAQTSALSRPMSAMWHETLEVNLTGAFLCCRAAFTAMAPAGEGRIVNIASLSGVYATEKFPGLAAYNVSKYGVIGLTEAIAVEGKEHGISAVCLSPGAVDTEMLRRANPALRPGLTPDDVAELIVALLDSPLAAASGANIPLFSNA